MTITCEISGYRIKVRKEHMKMIDPEKELLKSSEGDSYSSARLGKGRIALLIVVAVLIAALAGAWAMFGTQLTATRSATQSFPATASEFWPRR